jgi:outer membrane protein TolC
LATAEANDFVPDVFSGVSANCLLTTSITMKSRVASWLIGFLSMLYCGVASGDETLGLQECIARALARAPLIERAAATGDLGEARLSEARAALIPTLRSEVQYQQSPGYDTVFTHRGRFTGQLMADYIVYDGGRRLARERAAQYAAQADVAGISAARNQVILDTSVAFFELAHAHSAEKELASSQPRLERYITVEYLRKTGRATTNDMLKIRISASDNRLQLSAAREARRRASLMLGSLIGIFDRSDLVVMDMPIPSVPPDMSIDRNPVLVILGKQAQASIHEVEAATAERYPTLQLALAAGFLGKQPVSTLQRHGGAAYGGIISMPLFDGGAIQARIGQARAHERQLNAQLRQTKLELSQRLDQLRSQYDEAQEALAILANAIPLAEDNFNLAWARFLGGSTITLLEALDNYRQAENLRLSVFHQRLAVQRPVAEMLALTGEAICDPR